MSIVRFATLCDSCEARSPEYTSWPSCVECGLDTCSKCSAEDHEEEGYKDCLCNQCKKEGFTYDESV
jgi:hypothetical protein